MSLINDALKKAQAQQQRSPLTTASQISPSSQQPKGSRVGLYIGLMFGGGFFLTVVAVVLYLIFVNYEINQVLGPATPQTNGPVAPESATEQAPESIPEDLAPVQDQSLTDLEGVAPLTDEANTEITIVDTQETNYEVAGETVNETIDPTSDLQAWVDALQVRGVMAGAGKVLIYLPEEDYTAAFSTGEVIDKHGRLSLAQILPNRIVFKDNGGHEYIRRF